MILDTLQPISSPPRRKQPAVVEALLGLAQRLGPGAKLPTARELTKRLGVTGATLTRCLEQLEARGVLRCLQGSGIYVEAGVHQKRVALVFGRNIFSAGASAFGSLVLKHCIDHASEHNERFSFYLDTPAFHGVMNGVDVPAHQDLSDALKQGKLDGIILMSRNSVEQETWLRSQGIPVVCAEAGRRAFTNSPGIVHFDYRELIRQGVDRLCGVGCRTVGLIGVLREHEEMFRNTLQARGIPVKEKGIISPPTEAPIPAEELPAFNAAAAKQFLAQCRWSSTPSDMPDGLLFTDDLMANAILSAFVAQGLRIGQDLKICSHANKGSKTLAEWDILRVEFDPADMATGLFDVLEAAMAGTPLPSPYLIGPVAESSLSRA
ncbi:MAG: substrate-binding domain-containing protein [Terrimicrobiaceae bacterium]